MSNIQTFVTALQAAHGRMFHFTDGQNLETIRRFGLLPTIELRRRGIRAVTGGDDASLRIDEQRGFNQYVRLSFCRHHPMSHTAVQRGSIKDLRLLQICPTVLLREDVLISDRVATANEAHIAYANDMIHQMDFEATYRYIDWNTPENYARRNAAEKWEALIPGVISPDLILFGL